jgi:hypothetical protein
VVSAPRARAATPAATAPTEEPGPAPESVPLLEERAKKGERARRAVASFHAEAAPAPDQLNAEVEVLKRARDELRRGRPAQALVALAEYDRRFSSGVLAEERHAIAAIAGCQAAPGPAARAQAQAFLRQAPASPLRERVVEACITPRGSIAP